MADVTLPLLQQPDVAPTAKAASPLAPNQPRSPPRQPEPAAPLFGQIRSGRDTRIVLGLGAGGVARLLGVALLASKALRPAPVIDQDLIGEEALEAGFIAPEDAAALRAQLDRTQANLSALRPDQW